MKKLLIISLVMLSFSIISCKKEQVPSLKDQDQQTLFLDNKIPITDPGSFLFGKCNDWVITSFKNNGVDQTYDFHLMKMNFCPDNTVMLYNDILAVSGNWYFVLDKGNPQTFILQLNNPYVTVAGERPFGVWGDLTGTWNIVKFQKNLLGLQNGQGDHGLKVLVIERLSKQLN